MAESNVASALSESNFSFFPDAETWRPGFDLELVLRGILFLKQR